MKITPDSTHRILLTREIRHALHLKRGQSLEVSITPGAVLLTPVPAKSGKLIRKHGLKVYRGKIPNIDVEEAIGQARDYTRL